MTNPSNRGGDETLPAWYSELRKQWLVGTRLFILDFNVRDLVFVPGHPPGRLADPASLLPLRNVADWLCEHCIQKKFDVVLTCSLTNGLQVYAAADSSPSNPYFIRTDPVIQARREGRSLSLPIYQEMGKQAVGAPFPISELFASSPTAESIRHTLDPIQMMQLLDRLLTQQYLVDAEESPGNARPIRIALLIDPVEHLAPSAVSRGMGARDLVMMTEMLNRWSLDERIRKNRHLVVMLADDIHQVASSLVGANTGIYRIRLSRPGRSARRQFLEWVKSSGRPIQGETLSGLAGLTAGFNFAELNSLVLYAHRHQAGQITHDEIRRRKAKIIETESRELLEVIEPSFGWERVGGLQHVIAALTKVAEWLRQQSPLVPKGMLFVGPPGTGKSFVAQALAREGQVNLVKLKDIQSMYVGESERNMTRALEVAQAFEPVIIFVDEIDQAYGQRGGYQGDSGVTARIFGKILEFTGDNANRGRVLWIAASNRPDMIDAALLRRFDRIIPFLLPSRRERQLLLLQAMPKIAEFEWLEGDQYDRWPEALQTAFGRVLDVTDGYSGSELEKIVRRGLELSDQLLTVESKPRAGLSVDALERACRDYRNNRGEDMYKLQTCLALLATDFKDFLPCDLDALYDDLLSGSGGERHIDFVKVSETAEGLQRKVSRP